MLFSGHLTRAELLLHYAFKPQCRVLLPSSRSFTRKGQQLPQVKLTWDSFTPDNSIGSVEDAANSTASNAAAAAKHREKVATAAAAAAAAEAEAANSSGSSGRHLTLSAEDVKFLRSGLSPLSLLGEGEGEGEAKLKAIPAKGVRRPAGCPNWGRVSEPAALPAQRSASETLSAKPPLNPTYNECARRDWARHFLKPATNPWQELVQLTAEGKLWHFPVDNEQGRELEPEGRLSFQRHVMLDRRLQGWVPKSGPVRHFMETVCVGLSKNPHLSVAEKEAHLDWYKGYFADKLDDIQTAYAESVATSGSGDDVKRTS